MKTAGKGTEVAAFKQAFLESLRHALGRSLETATPHDKYFALALTVRSRLLDRWSQSLQVFQSPDTRVVCYLSAEYLLGPHLVCALINLGARDAAREAMQELGLDLDGLAALEEEPGLGNGGLGRLAACYLESLATDQIPAVGYGIRYEFGIFDQAIRDGAQVEITDKWLRHGNPWEIPRPEIAYPVGFGGKTEPWTDHGGRTRVRWHPEKMVRGVAYDTPIPGYRVGNVTLLRLFSAEAVESFDFASFNLGDYYGAVEKKVASETLTKVLYPNDEGLAGKTLRLQQQYFFVSCALRDMLRVHHQAGLDLARLHHSVVAQLNDTHPAVGVAELMRLLMDEHAMGWEQAWEITGKVFAYTNHTLLPEALETWTVDLFGKVLPRHLEIVYEINRRFLEDVRRRFPGDEARAARMSLIDERGERRVRMAHLATVGGTGGQRCGRTALRAPEARRAAGFPRAVAGEVQERDQRRDPAPVHGGGEPRPLRPPGRGAGSGLAGGFGALDRPGAAGAGSRVPPALAEDQGREPPGPLPRDRAAHGHRRGPRGADGRAGQAHPRVQAPAPERAARDRALPQAQARARSRPSPPDRALRREGGPRLRHGQAHHPAHPPGGGGGQRRS
jgi:glucan phosphorylase